MLLVVCLIPFACALILFFFGFDRFMGSSDTPHIADAMRQINHSDFESAEPEPPRKMAASA